MSLVRSFDSEFVNAILNHPEVYPWICGPLTCPLDFSPILANHSHYFLSAEDGGFLFYNCGDGRYDLHTQFLPDKKTNVFQALREAIDYMFKNTDCTTVTTAVVVGHKAAKVVALRTGFKYSHTEGESPLFGVVAPIEHFELHKAVQ